MPTVNGPDEITTLEGGDDKVFFSNSDGEITEVSSWCCRYCINLRVEVLRVSTYILSNPCKWWHKST